MASVLDHPAVRRAIALSYAGGVAAGMVPAAIAISYPAKRRAALIALRSTTARALGLLARSKTRDDREAAVLGKAVLNSFGTIVYYATKKQLTPDRVASYLAEEGAAAWDAFLSQTTPQEIERLL